MPVLSRACDFSPGQTLTDLGTPLSGELRVRPQRQVLDGLVAGMSLNNSSFFFVLGYAVPVLSRACDFSLGQILTNRS